MSKTEYKSTNQLMRHLRDNGIDISGKLQKQQLINTGYFHGYKGYRFFGESYNKIPFISYKEINASGIITVPSGLCHLTTASAPIIE